MHHVLFPLRFLAVAMRASGRPPFDLVRTLAALMTAIPAAAICMLCLHPFEAVGQALPAGSASSARSAASAAASTEATSAPVFEPGVEPAVDPPLPPPASQPAATKGPAQPPRKAATRAPRPAAVGSGDTSTKQEAGSTERLVWDKTPLQVALGVGPDRERAISFPAQMHIGVPQEVAQLLRVQTVGPTSYVTALAPFPRTRVVAEDRSTGSVILLDLSAAVGNTSTLPVTIVVPAAQEHSSRGTVRDDEEQAAPVDMVTLTRFAAQQMYAPRRLTGAHSGIRRVLVDRRPLEDLYAGGGVRAAPAAQWRSDEFYVTAVVLQSQQAQPLELDPLAVRGRWRAVTFQHGRLLGKGSEADTTVAYLVCERPFESCR